MVKQSYFEFAIVFALPKGFFPLPPYFYGTLGNQGHHHKELATFVGNLAKNQGRENTGFIKLAS